MAIQKPSSLFQFTAILRFDLFLFRSSKQRLFWGSIFFALACSGPLQSQGFVNIAPEQNMVYTNPFGNWGSGISLADWNQDGYPDVTLCRNNGPIAIYTQDDGAFVLESFAPNSVGEGKSIQWVDIDNDHDLDLFQTQENGPVLIFEQTQDSLWVDRLPDSNIPSFILKSSCASWADYDLDGDLDLYLSSYILDEINEFAIPEDSTLWNLWNSGDDENWPVVTNKLYRNDGDFAFTDVTSFAGVENGIQLTLATLFHDIDLDGWPDLLVANDKWNLNTYYRNLGNGQFEDLSEVSGFDLELDAMTLTEGDINQDGWRDFLITNTPGSTDIVLTYNPDTEHFDDITETHFGSLLESEWTWGARFMDIDNDTDLDVYIAEHHPYEPYIANHVLRNNGVFSNFSFSTPSTNIFPYDLTNAHSVASADWNRDGQLDFAVHNVGNHKVRMWENEGLNDNHFLNVTLVGTTSNAFAIGSWIEVYCDEEGSPFRNYTALGADYLSQSDFTQHFGLGQSTSVDSIRIHWPNGDIEAWHNLSTDQHLTLVEGSSVFEWATVLVSGPLCPEDSIVLLNNAPDGVNIEWMDQTTDSVFVVTSAGTYHWTWSLENGLSHIDSLTVELSWSDSISWSWTPALCATEPEWSELNLIVQDSSGLSIDSNAYELWIGQDSLSLPIGGGSAPFLTAGQHPVVLIHDSGCQWSDTLQLIGPDTLSWDLIEVLGLGNGDTLLSCPEPLNWSVAISGGTPPYSTIGMENIEGYIEDDSLFISSSSEGASFINIEDGNGCALNAAWSLEWSDPISVTIESGESGVVEALITGGIPPYSLDWYFAADSTDVFNLQKGWITSLLDPAPFGFYELVVTDSIGCLAHSSFEFLPDPSNIFHPINELQIDLKRFTDPVTGIYTWKAPMPGTWVVIDSNGKRIYQSLSETQEFTWSAPQRNGLLCIRWTSGDGKRESSDCFLNLRR